MPSYLAKTEIPRDKRDVVHLLFLVDDEINQLSADQIAAIRVIYRLDSDVTIEQLIRGYALTNGMEDETKAINEYRRGDLP
jgi:hypothetical protein